MSEPTDAGPSPLIWEFAVPNADHEVQSIAVIQTILTNYNLDKAAVNRILNYLTDRHGQ